ncbi:MAG TPA: GNAT family N-acetyltransferase [Galbitalea sp.]|jgi:GNAT superfamily N-acetyltransferase|nr:GNAT family N-acetyltransferase [Galbitalea sp.]
MTILVRRAELSDARGIAEVHVQGWREAYAHLVPEENLARLSVDQRELRWAEIIPHPNADIWVATDVDRVIGFAGGGTSQDPEPVRDLELQSLYVLADYYGTGAGQRLLDAVLSDKPASLWVADDNPRARAFYARNRFVPDGIEKMGPLMGTDILETRLVR